MTAAETAEKIETLQRDAAAARNRARYETDAGKKAKELKAAERCDAEAKALAKPAAPATEA